ncbi:MFS transporter [Candidatus Pacearchaeota archaeon]|nr:MFS transporter [Candidatus Pacearchaeota archaeon]
MTKKQKDSPKIKELKHKARRKSIKEGIFFSAKSSFGDRYISPFAIAINASNSMVALLSSVSGLLGPLAQIFSSRLIEKHSRKKIILKAIFFESLMWLPLIIMAILFYKGILVNTLPLLLLLSFSLYIILANIGSPAWFSWVGDLVDEKYRGRWFSKRNLITGFVSAILAIFSSFFLNYFKQINLVMFGFIILFSLAFISRLVCWKIFKKLYEPKIKLKKGYYFSFWNFLKNAPKNNFGKFSIFRALLNFACSISSPLLAVYLLRNLKFNYPTYMIIIMSSSIFSLIVLNGWGKFADKYGNYKVLGITSILIPIVPFLWIFSPFPVYLIFIPALISGISWAGFTLATGNFIYDNVSQQKRGLAISYCNMLNGIGIFLGAGLGALLIKFLTISFIEPISLIFIIGGITRMMVVFFGIPKIKEMKKTKKFDSSKIIKNIRFKQAKSTLMEEAHEIMSIKEYLRTK